jgi:hypothetical protein
MWRGTQFRVAAAKRVQCAATTFIVVGLVVVVGAANPAPLPDGCGAAISGRSVVPTPAIATRAAPTLSCNPTPVASNTQAQGDSSIRTVAAGRTGSTLASSNSRIAPHTIPIWMPPPNRVRPNLSSQHPRIEAALHEDEKRRRGSGAVQGGMLVRTCWRTG